jgi:hypothetical protein
MVIHFANSDASVKFAGGLAGWIHKWSICERGQGQEIILERGIRIRESWKIPYYLVNTGLIITSSLFSSHVQKGIEISAHS